MKRSSFFAQQLLRHMEQATPWARIKWRVRMNWPVIILAVMVVAMGLSIGLDIPPVWTP